MGDKHSDRRAKAEAARNAANAPASLSFGAIDAYGMNSSPELDALFGRHHRHARELEVWMAAKEAVMECKAVMAQARRATRVIPAASVAANSELLVSYLNDQPITAFGV
jgi:hypothetical protein